MFSSGLMKFVVVFLFVSEASSWRRRRRRAPIPPPTNCQVSAWSSWSICDKKCDIGGYSRSRVIVRDPAFGGAECPALRQTGQCGAKNGGCQYACRDSDGKCSCQPGFELQGDQKSCGDIDECTKGTSSCMNANCQNNQGSYSCTCLPGFEPTKNINRCSPKNCAPLTSRHCPAGAYYDRFSRSCVPVNVSCPNGHGFLESCTLTCPQNYKLATIAQPLPGEQFGENFTMVDFTTPNDKTTCFWDALASEVMWDWNPQHNAYYCRRVNDPPKGVGISTSKIHEREPFLTLVGNLSAVDPQNDKLTFSIENAEGNKYFLIQNNELLVKSLLVWLPISTATSNMYSVVVKATDNGSPAMYSNSTISITVLNINDPPHDIELSTTEVPENIPINSVLGNLTAIDDDIGPQRSSNFSWQLVDDDNDFFSLRGNQVLVAKSLDHETRNFHKIMVHCSDFGEPKRTSANETILISVRDENDSPKSLNLTKHHVPENSDVGTVVGYVEARDDDNDTLLFALNGTESKVLKKFQLKGPSRCKYSTNGGKEQQTCSIALVVNGSLDFEEADEYTVWVAVADPGSIIRRKFGIKIDNVNELPTEIILTNNFVPENSPAGAVVGDFVVSDPDNKNRLIQSHTCSLANSPSGDEDFFVIVNPNNRNILQIKPKKTLNFEQKKEYNISVTCEDTERLGLTKWFIITVTDVNEKPTSLYLSNKKLKENSPGVTLIGNLSAQDPEGSNQTLVYTVSRSSSGNFFVNGIEMNQLYANGSVDFESTPRIRVHVRVADNGGLHLEKIFSIDIEDVNDAPTNIVFPGNVSLHENSVERVFIGRVSVIDQDSNSKASCELVDNSNGRVLLEGLNLLVGPVKTDYESLNSSKSLKILLNCSDEHGAAVAKWLNILVRDVNEAPTDLTLNNLQVRENRNGSLVGVLRITDPDINQRHNCTIINNPKNDEPLFYVDSSTTSPLLKTARALDFEKSREHTVDIQCEDIVIDNSQRRLVKEQQFLIAVIDVNETPVINCNTSFYAPPSSSNGSVIGKVEGYDPDNEEYYRSKKSNPKGPYAIKKQLLNYRIEVNNYSWPIDISDDGVLYFEKQLKEEEYTSPLVLSIIVEDNGIVLERVNSSRAYQIKKDEQKHSVQRCQVIVTSNLTDKDIHLSSNRIFENATKGTIVGKLSRKTNSSEEKISYQIIDKDAGPFEVDEDILYLSINNSLDYERLLSHKTLPVTISSRGPVSGVFTKNFLIYVIDVNEKPTGLCLLPPLSREDCTVIGHILIEDLDYPELYCGNSQFDLKNTSEKLSEYRCHVQKEDPLNNKVKANQYFNISQDLFTLYADKAIFADGDRRYSVPIVCKSSWHPEYILQTTLSFNISVPSQPTCRNTELCSSCPEPVFCLTHVKVAGTCVAAEYRINSTVNIPGSYFEKQGFTIVFEQYIKSLVEKTSGGKTLKQLMTEFDDQNAVPSRRRRSDDLSTYQNIYVELFIAEKSPNTAAVVFAVAENFKLILAAKICLLLKDSEVKCQSDNTTPNQNTGDKNDSAGFPLWIIFVIVGVLVLALIVAAVILRRRQQRKKYNTRAVHFARDGETAYIDSMYESPVENPDDTRSGNADPVLVEKRRDIKVFNNPMYRARQPENSDDEESTLPRTRTLNHYEKAPDHLYQTIDDDFYEKVDEERKEESKSSRKKSRSNPVYNLEEDEDDTLNPVVHLAVSPSKKLPHDQEISDDSLTTEIMRTFNATEKQKISEGRFDIGIANPTYVVGGEKTNDDVFESDTDQSQEQNDQEHSSC